MCKISAQYVKTCRRKVRKMGGRRPGRTDGESDGRTDGRRVGRTDGDPDGHHHTMIRPVWRRAYNKSSISGAYFVPIGIPTIYWYTMPLNCTYIFSMRKVKASLNSVQVEHLYESYFLLEKNPALSEVQRYVFYSLLKHNLTRDKIR